MDYSISIGIDNYLHFNPTPCSENDAKAFFNTMKEIYCAENSKIVLKDKATYKNVESEINAILKKLEEDDRFFFFFAGHGKNIDGEPYLCMYDSNRDFQGSWHNLMKIIELVGQTGCKKNLFFIDACESTLRMGTRTIDSMAFSIDELKISTYSYVISSCSHKQVADIIPEENHGIWSYVLLRGIRGEDPKALKNKTSLTNVSLANYLSVNVKYYTKTNPKCSGIQNSFFWGKGESEFLIREFSPVAEYQDIRKSKAKSCKFVTVSIEGLKDLSGFKRGLHTVPKFRGASAERFINDISKREIEDHIDSVGRSLRDLFGLKRKDYEIHKEPGFAKFECPYFSYTYQVEILEDDLSKVKFSASLRPYEFSKIVSMSAKLDDCFPSWFEFLVFSLPKPIDISKLIDFLEEQDQIEFDYESDCSEVTISNPEKNREIVIFPDEVRIKFKVQEEIPQMLDALKSLANTLLPIYPNYKLLG